MTPGHAVWMVSIHPTIHDKPPAWRSEFAENWRQEQLTFSELEGAILSGKAFVPAAMTSSRRSSSAFASSALVVIDIDQGLSIEEFLVHPLAGECAIAYTTPSHRDQRGGHRLRAIFPLAEPIEDPELYSAVVTALIHQFDADASCKDCCRLFYGNSCGRLIASNHSARLDPQWLEAGRRLLAAKPQVRAAGADERAIETARHLLLHVLPPIEEGQRDLFTRITAAVASEADELAADWQDWVSRGSRSGNRRESSEKFLRGFKGTSLATLFHLADGQVPGWREQLPEQLKAPGDSAALDMASGTRAYGYSLADFMDEDDAAPAITDERLGRTADLLTAVLNPPAPGGQGQPGDDGTQGPPPPPGPMPAAAATSKAKAPSASGAGSELDLALQLIDAHYPGARLNLLTLQIEYVQAGRYVPVDDTRLVYLQLSRGQSRVLAKSLCEDALMAVARSRATNPVTEYLDHCASQHQPIEYFDQLASTLLGLTAQAKEHRTPAGTLVADDILRRTLIGAVARAYQPGCPHSWMPILVGPQNCGKSNFWKYLTPVPAGKSGTYPLHATIQQGISYIKDRPHALHAGWIVVLDEVNRYFSRRYVEEFKNIVSVAVDLSARKYENERVFPRSFILAGATNSTDFLVDPTGNRRFMPIQVQGVIPSPQNPGVRTIDLDRLKRDRDRIWAAAVHAYRARPQDPGNEFTSAEFEALRTYSSDFHRDSALTEQVAQVLSRNSSGVHEGKSYVTLADVMRWLQVPIDRQPQLQQAVIDELKIAGYVPLQCRIAGRVRRIWVPER